MAKLQLVVPYLTYIWCLEDMLNSFGESDVPVLIVDNSAEKDTDRMHMEVPPNVEIVKPEGNIGVCASWNLGLAKGADQTLLLSQWVRFAPAELPWRERRKWGLDHVADGIARLSSPWGMEFADQGYHCISIGRETVNEIGVFDENFTVFGSDDDYQHRRELAGIRGAMTCWGDYEESGVFSIAFSAHKRTGIYEDVARYHDAPDYYSAKWCSKKYDYPGDFKTPFNNPDHPLSYWPKPGEEWK